MTDAEKAYEAAETEIERMIEEGETELVFYNKEAFKALETLPPKIAEIPGLIHVDIMGTEVADITPLRAITGLKSLDLCITQINDLTPLQSLTKLQELYLRNTQVSDVTPLQSLTGLLSLDLSRTQVEDISPLAALKKLSVLSINDSKVADLRPIAGENALGTKDVRGGLNFNNTPAADATPELKRISELEDYNEAARQVKAYFKDLPPWPEPLPWELTSKPKAKTQELELPPIEAILDPQTSAGWRWSPIVSAMVLHIPQSPTDARQDTLAKMVMDRLQQLQDTLAKHQAQDGIRKQVADETAAFIATLADDTRALSARALEMWGNLIALGSQLEANDEGRKAARDPLDLLPAEARAALQTLLPIAANLVRSFPDTADLDNGYADFARQSIDLQHLLDAFKAAVDGKFVDTSSAQLVNQVAQIAGQSGVQGQKAETATVFGARNLWLAAALSAPLVYAATGVADGALTDIGTDISNHYQLGEAAIQFLDHSKSEFQHLIDNLPPDERALTKAQIEDAEATFEKIRSKHAHEADAPSVTWPLNTITWDQ